MPNKVPIHFNLYGEADKWGDKINLMYLATLIPLGAYIMFLLAKYIDPKNKITQMGNKYYVIRLLLTTILASIIIALTYSIANKTETFNNIVFIILGFVFVFLGNYFRNIKPNYFIGFRTPWTLENETIWRKTHQHCSIVWFVGGLFMVFINAFSIINSVWLVNALTIIFLIITPIAYSYNQYKNL